jgi:hypothetical protein
MEIFISAIAASLTVIGSLLPIIFTAIRKKKPEVGTELEVEETEIDEVPLPTPGPERWTPAMKVLLSFAAIVFVFGVFVLVYYWDNIKQNPDDIIFFIGLFIFMVFGMFAQVIASNYYDGKPPFDITVPRLVFPLLFSVIVYYTIWALASMAPKGFYAFYAAFLNGYFWENIVSKARPQT